MARRKSIFPGSVFADRGKLYIKVRVEGERDSNGKPLYKKIPTGLDDTAQGRKLAEEKKKNLFIHRFLPPDQIQQQRHVYMKDAWNIFAEAKSLSKKTVQNYKLAFDTITRKQNYVLHVEAVERDVLYFKNTLALENKLSPATINSYLTQFQAFLNFCTRKKWIEKTWFKSEHRRKDARTTIKIFSEEEIARLIPVLRGDDIEFSLFVELMLLTGVRPVDALTLHFENWRGRTIIWENKITKRSEETPISLETERVMNELRVLRQGKQKVFRWQHSSLSSLTRKFDAMLRKAEIEKQGRNFKHFRTTFKFRIRHLPFELQMKLMRHARPDVTLNNYTYYNAAEISAKLDSLFHHK
jgi:integrase